MEDGLKKNEKMQDNLNQKKRERKTTSKKMEDKPINQNQPNWL